MSAAMHDPLDRWLREGRPRPMPEHVARHLDGCAACREAIARVDELRGWFAEEPAGLSQDAAAAIRFRLQAEARATAEGAASRLRGRERARDRWRRAVALSAVAAVAAAVVVGRVLSRGDDVAGPEAAATPRGARPRSVSVSASAGARYERVRAAPDEAFRVHAGVVTFDVERRAPGRRFRVLVGGDVVEVRGTRFRVEARDDVLASVTVEHGIVAVRLASGEEHLLLAGGRYARVEPPTLAASGPAAGERAAGAAPGGEAPGGVAGAASRSPAARAPRAHAERVAGPRRGGEQPDDVLDRGFRDAWQLRRNGRHDEAARAFDALLARRDARARRADLLYWSAREHEQAGRPATAARRYGEVVRGFPGAWHAADARRRLDALSPGNGATPP